MTRATQHITLFVIVSTVRPPSLLSTYLPGTARACQKSKKQEEEDAGENNTHDEIEENTKESQE